MEIASLIVIKRSQAFLISIAKEMKGATDRRMPCETDEQYEREVLACIDKN